MYPEAGEITRVSTPARGEDESNNLVFVICTHNQCGKPDIIAVALTHKPVNGHCCYFKMAMAQDDYIL